MGLFVEVCYMGMASHEVIPCLLTIPQGEATRAQPERSRSQKELTEAVGEVAVVQLARVAMHHSHLPSEIIEKLAWALLEMLLSKEVKDILHRMVVDGSEGFV